MVRPTGGKGQYYHRVEAAVSVHPIMKQVILLAAEPIIRRSGDVFEPSSCTDGGRK